MTDWHDLDVTPARAFADRLEGDLLRTLRAGTDRSEPVRVSLDPSRSAASPAPRRRARWWLVAAALAVLATVGGIAALRGDDGSAPAENSDLRFDVQWPDLSGLERPECVQTRTTYVWAQAGRCLRQFTGEVELSGDITGTALWSMSGGVGDSDDGDASVERPAAFGATYLVKADIPGCGSGEFVIVSSLSFVGWQAGGFVGDWSIVPGSGRDDLVAVEGGGAVLPQIPSGQLDADQPRPHVGTIVC